MPRDVNGVYTLPAGNPVVTATTITSTWANTTLDDIKTALTASLSIDGSVTAAKLATNAVTTVKITDLNVTTAKIADGGVTAVKLAADAVTTAKILDANVTTAKIAPLAVTTATIADANVTTAKIADGGVTAVKLAADAVTTAKILDANVTTAKIADANVTTAKIAPLAVTTATIADANVTTAKIADLNVTTAKIADANVTTGKIADLNVTTAKIADANVTTAKIADDAVTYAKIQDVSATDRILGRSSVGAGIVEEIVCTAAGRNLIDDTTVAAQHATLGLGTMATQAGSAVDITGGNISGLFSLGVNGLFTAGGGQIKFPAVQAPSTDVNTLDDYEEGTWTPTFTLTSPGDISIVYTDRVGSYTKVGDRVVLDFVLTCTPTYTTGSGSFIVTGIPFQPNATSTFMGSLMFGGITKAGYTQFTLQAVSTSSRIFIVGSGSGQALSNVSASNIPSGTFVELYGSIVYRVA